ncbi:MAG: hypothetical protein JW864_12620 [Spirochaetes bacterium]|nr:hypothetical protein [Spirochaetota bacterium]
MNINFSKLENKRHLFLLMIFLVIFILRLPTFFNDYYDVDELSAIIQTHEYMAGDTPGIDFKESKLPLYHILFKAAYSILPENGWILVHVFTVFIVFFTSFFIYLSGIKIYNFKTGAIASLFYGIFTSSFNRHFLATNGEIVYNLLVAAGLYFLILLISDRNKNILLKLIISILIIISGIAAANVKFHGIILFIFIACFFIIYLPYHKKINSKYFYLILIIPVIMAAVSILDYYFFNKFANSLFSYISGKISYAFVKDFNPLTFIAKYIHRQGMLILWHFAAWIPATIFTFKFIKNRFKNNSIETGAALVLFILTYLMIFLGGSRLYFHYFLAAYPGLCIVSAVSLQKPDTCIVSKIKKRLPILLMIPAIFFLLWNTKDIIIKHYFPQAFYNEGKLLYWTRAVLIGTFNDYLLPEASYREVCSYIKETTNPGDRIFVWGDGPYLYYFSERRMGIRHLWPKTTIYRITNLYNEGKDKSIKEAEKLEQGFIDVVQEKEPVLFIDTSANGLSTFHYKLTPLFEKFVLKNYIFIKEINRMKIYRRKSMEEKINQF